MAEPHEKRAEPLILNVNDSEGARYLVTRTLERAGLQVIEAQDGSSALEKIWRRRPDLIVMDVKLPDIDGFELCRRVRANPETASIKIIHTSATYVTLDKKVQSLEGGADAYLPQPFERQELLAIVRSLLRLNRAEQVLREDAEQLREADRRKNTFLAMLAHELRNPLSAMGVSLPIIMRRDPMDEFEERAREVLVRQHLHLKRLIDDLLEVSRVTQGKIEMRWEVLDLVELLRRVVDGARQARLAPLAQELLVELDPGPVLVRGDATRLEQVFTNLLDNASKYSGPGGKIGVRLRAEGRFARVIVHDNGIGMSQETVANAFSLFYQADVPTARSQGGLGIGLTLVRTLVELHGGEAEARSEGLGEGSELEVRLPLVDANRLETAPASRAPSRQRRRRVLVVEDNPDARQMLVDLLEVWGHEALSAADGSAGVAEALAHAPEVALVDIGLPGIDGYEVARRLRAAFPKGTMILVALTGYGAADEQARSLDIGFDLHLVKPVDTSRLRELLDGS